MNAMRTSILPRYFLVPALALAAMGILASSSWAQNADIPVVSIRSGGTATPEYCPPNADCVGLNFVLTRTGPRLDSPLQVLVFFGGTAAYGIDYQALPGP